jgi:hypothetical protein
MDLHPIWQLWQIRPLRSGALAIPALGHPHFYAEIALLVFNDRDQPARQAYSAPLQLHAEPGPGILLSFIEGTEQHNDRPEDERDYRPHQLPVEQEYVHVLFIVLRSAARGLSFTYMSCIQLPGLQPV